MFHFDTNVVILLVLVKLGSTDDGEFGAIPVNFGALDTPRHRRYVLGDNDYIIEDETEITNVLPIPLRRRREAVNEPGMDQIIDIEGMIDKLIMDEFGGKLKVSRKRRMLPSSEGSGAGPDCENTGSPFFCNRFASKGKCLSERAIAFSQCQASCNLCDENDCTDTRPGFCAWFSDTNRCGDESDNVSKYTCPKSCNLCTEAVTCVDEGSEDLCNYVTTRNKCRRYGSLCQRSCELCTQGDPQ